MNKLYQSAMEKNYDDGFQPVTPMRVRRPLESVDRSPIQWVSQTAAGNDRFKGKDLPENELEGKYTFFKIREMNYKTRFFFL